MNTTTAAATESIRVPRLGYGTRVRYAAAAAAVSVAATAGIVAIANSDGGSGGGPVQPQTISRTGFGFGASQAGAVGAAQTFHHRTGQTLRSTLTPTVSTSQAVERFHHR